MRMYKIHFIRHGLTQANFDQRFIGVTDEILCNEGVLQLEKLKNDHEYPKIQKVYTSPLKRCLETAEIIFPENYCETVDELIEYNFGEFEGQTIRDNENLKQWVLSGQKEAPINGESKQDFDNRCEIAIKKIIKDMMKNKITSVAVVTHGGVITNILNKYGIPKLNQIDLIIKNGYGYTVGITSQLWSMSDVFEIFDKLPYVDNNLQPNGYTLIDVVDDEIED